MHFIEHIIEPTTLFLAWQSSDENNRTRYIVAEIKREKENITLRYLTDTPDFHHAQQQGFEGYPAFQDFNKIHINVLDALMRRLPPKTRGDFTQYLEGLRIKPNAELSPFALLGYSGARLPSDGFSIIHAFGNIDGECELLLEAVGFRHIQKFKPIDIQSLKIGDSASFLIEETNEVTHEPAVGIVVGSRAVGYVNKGLIPTFIDWIRSGRIRNAWIEKKNGSPENPTVYLYVRVLAK
jgi:hypothetical protein